MSDFELVTHILQALSASLDFQADAALLSEAVQFGALIEAPTNLVDADGLAKIWAGRSARAGSPGEGERCAVLANFFRIHESLEFRVIGIGGKHSGAVYFCPARELAACLTWTSD